MLVRPRRETGVDRIVVFEDALRDAAAGRDHHNHHRARLEHEDLDVADGRRVERRRGDERQQAVACDSESVVD